MRTQLAILTTLMLSSAALAQDNTPEGIWQDEFGTTLSVSFCADDATDLCVTLLDVQGESRTEANLAYINEQIMKAENAAPDKWEGIVIFEGKEAEGTLTQVSPNSVEIEGCRALVFCETLAFKRK